MIKISVSASRNYDVIMERGALARAGTYVRKALGMAATEAAEACADAKESAETDRMQRPNAAVSTAGTAHAGKKICIITDANVDVLYGQPEHHLWRSLTEAGFVVDKYVFPGGEAHKNMDTVASILEYLAAKRFSRSDVLLALGGGITGDVTGFAAAAYLRGVDFIQVPTSLLAVVDSSVGGKTGVNLAAGKNLAGAFWQPSLVLFDPDVLKTLSDDLKLDGIAEAVKAGIIADPSIVEMTTSTMHAAGAAAEPTSDPYISGIHCIAHMTDSTGTCPFSDDDLLMRLAARAVEVKRRIVEEDERENGIRQLLNLGHTVAHAIEKCSHYEISHGHAVAIGMDIVSAAADERGWSETKCHYIIRGILNRFGFPLTCPYTAAELTAAALQDKKVRGGEITLVIPARIGKCTRKTISTDTLEGFIACGLSAAK